MSQNDRMSRNSGPTDPAVGAVQINYSSDQTLAQSCRGFHCNTAGTIAVTMQDGSTGSFTCLAGLFYPYAVKTFLNSGSSGFAGYALL